MCVVSLCWQDNENWILTHNRDENRDKEFEPKFLSRIIDKQEVFAPIDKIGGGTWIFYSKKYVGCVLNGAFEFHMPGGKYKVSRGKLILDIVKHTTAEDYFYQLDLDRVEPFTFIIIDREIGERYQLVWDGKQKYFSKIEEKIFVWSSATLYTEKQKTDNRHFITKYLTYDNKQLLELHKQIKLESHPYIDSIKTTSISQLSSQNGYLKSCFLDYYK